MKPLSTTKMSSKGEVVIPEKIREKLGLKTGAQFLVIEDNDVVILKSITAPGIDEFDKLVTQAKNEARKAGLKKQDILNAVKKVRQKG